METCPTCKSDNVGRRLTTTVIGSRFAGPCPDSWHDTRPFSRPFDLDGLAERLPTPSDPVQLPVCAGPSPGLLAKALDERDRRPWRYYRLAYDDLKAGIDQRQDRVDQLEGVVLDAVAMLRTTGVQPSEVVDFLLAASAPKE